MVAASSGCRRSCWQSSLLDSPQRTSWTKSYAEDVYQRTGFTLQIAPRTTAIIAAVGLGLQRTGAAALPGLHGAAVLTTADEASRVDQETAMAASIDH